MYLDQAYLRWTVSLLCTRRVSEYKISYLGVWWGGVGREGVTGRIRMVAELQLKSV